MVNDTGRAVVSHVNRPHIHFDLLEVSTAMRVEGEEVGEATSATVALDSEGASMLWDCEICIISDLVVCEDLRKMTKIRNRRMARMEREARRASWKPRERRKWEDEKGKSREERWSVGMADE